MKRKYLRLLVSAKSYANTESEEKAIIRCLSILTGVLVLDVLLLIICSIL